MPLAKAFSHYQYYELYCQPRRPDAFEERGRKAAPLFGLGGLFLFTGLKYPELLVPEPQLYGRGDG